MEIPSLRRSLPVLALFPLLGGCEALGIPGQPPAPPPTTYSIHGEQGTLLAVARMKPAIFQGTELHFWGTFENRSNEELELSTSLRWIGRDDMTFAPGRFAPIAQIRLAPGRSLGNFVVFDLPFAPIHAGPEVGELELEIRAQTPGAAGALAKTFPVPKLRPGTDGAYFGATPVYGSYSSGGYSGGKTTVRIAPPPGKLR